MFDFLSLSVQILLRSAGRQLYLRAASGLVDRQALSSNQMAQQSSSAALTMV